MIRFIHTADIQLGMQAKTAIQHAQRLREARFKTLRRIVELAGEEEVDFVVIAGDLFEDNQVSAHTASRSLQLLQEASMPVYIVPGNHDWYDASSVYCRPEFEEDLGNVMVLRERQAVEVTDECALYPCPVFERWSYEDPTQWIPERETQDKLRIGIAHGTVPMGDEERILPIELDAAERRGLDYLALGHTHGLRRYADDRIAYPGTPEPTRFSEEGAGSVLVAELEAPGAAPRLEEHPVATLDWQVWEREVSAPADDSIAQIKSDVEQLEDGPNTLLRLTVSGALPADQLPALDEFETWLDARCENEQLLHAELASEVRTTEELAGALRRLAEADEVIAGAVADLRSMAAMDDAAPGECAGIAPRPRDELIRTWQEIGAEDLHMTVTANEALSILARLTREVEYSDTQAD